MNVPIKHQAFRFDVIYTLKTATKPENPFAKHKFFFGLLFSSVDKWSFSDAIITTKTGSGKLSYEFNTVQAYGFTLGLTRNSDKYKFGNSASINYESRRKIKSLTASANGNSISTAASGDATYLQVTTFDLDITYRWDELYIPFVLNISSITPTGDLSDVTVEFKGKLVQTK